MVHATFGLRIEASDDEYFVRESYGGSFSTLIESLFLSPLLIGLGVVVLLVEMRAEPGKEVLGAICALFFKVVLGVVPIASGLRMLTRSGFSVHPKIHRVTKYLLLFGVIRIWSHQYAISPRKHLRACDKLMGGMFTKRWWTVLAVAGGERKLDLLKCESTEQAESLGRQLADLMQIPFERVQTESADKFAVD